jgi:HK97 family phage portal protein
MNPVRRWLVDKLTPRPPMRIIEHEATRARPGQSVDAQMFAWATGPRVEQTLAMYCYSNWVMTAEDKLTSRAATAALQVQARNDPMTLYPEHPLLELLGEFGKPNDYQDALEFWLNLLIDFDLAGNAYIFWFSPFGGAPTECHLLEPYCMQVMPGVNQGVAGYIYEYQGHRYKLMPEQVTHFKRANPFSRYYGLSALEAAKIEIRSDRSMAIWNEQFFSEDVAVPAGAFVIPSDVSNQEMERFRDEVTARHGGRRATAVLRAAPGAVAYYKAGVDPKDLDFTNGRLLSRKAIYEALELPLGLMSEASTEAHARVAERQLFETIRIRHTRIARKLTIDALPFWPAARLRKVDFEDLSLRAADWDRESKRLAAVKPFMLRNEVRTRILHLPPIEGWDEKDKANGTSENPGQPQSGGRPDPLQPEGQVRDVVDGGNPD